MKKKVKEPHWIICKFQSFCEKCGRPLEIKEKAFYFPYSHYVYCEKCAQPTYQNMKRLKNLDKNNQLQFDF